MLQAGRERSQILVLLFVILIPQSTSADDEKVLKQLAKLDSEFLKALTELAKKYDKDQVPEAAHFFAGCALGLGAKDETLTSIKNSIEAAVYLGRMRGGEPLQETAPITGALGNLSIAYKKILDPWIRTARKGTLGDSTRKLMFDTGVKYELSRGAHEYVQAVQRFNALRRAIGIRAVLWDFEESRKLILAGWYTCETEDYEYHQIRKDSPFYTECVESGRLAARGLNRLPELPGDLRTYAINRQQLLNPNARTLRLAYWGGGGQIDYFRLYSIPQLPYREDIPTPIQRFQGETLVKDWVDIEETVNIAGKRIPYVKYPFQGEIDVPIWFSNGVGGLESGWARSEYKTLEHGGVPVMLRFFTQAMPSEVESSLVNRSGTHIPCRAYTNRDERVSMTDWATVLLLPEQQLESFTDYTVNVKCQIDSTRIEKSWTFKTRGR